MVNVATNPQQNKVWYNGQLVPAKKDALGKLYIEVDGKRLEVDPNDLFGMNSNLNEWPERMANYWGGELTDAKEEMKRLAELEYSLKKEKKNAQSEYDKYMTSIGFKRLNEITDGYERKEAKSYLSKVTDLSSSIRLTTNQFLSQCRRGFDAALRQGEWQNQQALAEKVLQG